MKKIRKISVYIFLVILSAICLFPFFIMFNNSTQSTSDLSIRLSLLPGKELFNNYRSMMDYIPFWTYIRNSLIATLPNVLLTAYFGTMAAYGFEKFEFKGKNILFAISMMMMVIPAQISLIGLYRMFSAMKLLNTTWTLILPGICNVLTVYWMRGNIYQIVDTSLLEAATIDGCGQMGIFHKIVLPLCKSGIVTISIINFVAVWNDYINPVTFITKTEKTTLSVGIAMLNNFDYVDLGAIYIAIALSTIVILVFYILFNSQIMGGVAEGSVKG